MATIQDIKNATGVSCSAISRILNNDPTFSVSDATRRKVVEAARKLDYHKYKKSSAALKKVLGGEARHLHPNDTLGILQWFSREQELEDTYYLYIRHGIEDYCLSHAIHLVRSVKSDPDYIEALQGVDALICIGKFHQKDLQSLKKISKHILLLDMETEDSFFSSITLDYEETMIEVLEDLCALGHHRIGFLGGKEYIASRTTYPDRRKEVFETFAKEHGIEYQDYLYIDRFSSRSGYDMARKLIHQCQVNHRPLPSAIMAASDPIAMGAMRALQDAGYSIPEDISIVGFDDTEGSAYTRPALSTIHTPAYHMGEYGASVLSTLLCQKDAPSMKMKLSCSYVKRETVAPVPVGEETR
ncbi:MAG: LacI family DNA-binding transcriptional regulator [Lachnospiraceae bacterium]|nr:LacI family DNA-binding transcriptional regulator [Lachnospiraceae bacterium]